MSRIIDISVPISPGLAPFPGNPAPIVEAQSRIIDGEATNKSILHLGSHAGTHVDAPAHLLDGADGVDAVALDVLVGDAQVVDATSVERLIRPSDLEAMSIERGVIRVLFLTRNSIHWQRPEMPYPIGYVALGSEAAEWLIERGVRLVGTDGLSIEPFGAPGRPTHRALIEAGVIIVEGLDLAAVRPGRYTLICLPLRVVGGDGSPARAILVADRP